MTLPQDHPLESELFEFVRSYAAPLNAIPDRLRSLLKDQFALQLAGSGLPWALNVSAYAALHARPGRATVAGGSLKADAATAAFLNAVFAHGLQYDDVVSAASGHPGSCAVPVAFALGEEAGASIAEVLGALLCGYEVYARLGILAAPDLIRRGWQPHSVLSSFGAAAIASRLWRLAPTETFEALSIAASLACGTTEYTSTGGETKRVQCGIGARHGIRAAAMALAGITGPDRFLSGSKGFFEVYVGRAATRSDAFALHHEPCLNEVWFKPYCCCAATHAAIDAAFEFRHRALDLDRVEVHLPGKSNRVVGSYNEHIYQPRSITEIQFSLPVQVALALLGHRNGYATHKALMDGRAEFDFSEVLTFARRVHVVEDASLDVPYDDKWVARSVFRFRDGTSAQRFVEDSRGTPSNPLDAGTLRAKYDELIAGADARRQGEVLWNAVDNIDLDGPVDQITRWLAR